MKEKLLKRDEILKGNYRYPKINLNLIPTTHALEMIKMRALESDKIPTNITITRKNIYSAKCKDGKNLYSMVIKINFDSKRSLFLCIAPFDGGLKTLWFKEKNKNYDIKS